ncbi:MAG TPA: LPS-assembly protein LptD [Firmicutes bacterium]|uniref:LPS-assembly protein LptD n=1 Tax=Capillibacterium thermochitinicola TaxID=2699427 RepID=A0A8J6LL38_9FIRM|nr:LPS-assembly protein LptD [Capillibacterium thermochitinicola]MBA2132094.1 LPS-assembly protein LptD [Capillibacterium thermochitinicola]HHW12841.1 LPS-assembly protein LptD [Bacillota bacterium]
MNFMQLTKVKIVGIVLCFILLAGVGTPALATSPREVEIEARLVEFDPDSGVYRASGGVILTSGDFQLQAETVLYNQETEVITAEQGVKLKTATGNWEGESLVYSFRTEEGTLTAFRGAMGSAFYTGQTGELRGEEIRVQGASFTRCELTSPCVKIKAGRVRLVEDRVQVSGGWLYLKNFPVLPLPPLAFRPDQFENWPQLEIGVNSTRGFYVLGRLTHQVNEQVDLNYSGGVGTNRWWNVQGGIRWDLLPGLVFNSTLTWEDYLRGNASLTYKWAPLQFRTAVQHNWADLPSGEHSFSVMGPLSKKSNLEFSYTSSFNEKKQGEQRRADYGLRLTGRWLPGFTLGAGLFYGEGDLKSNSLNGWHLRTTWSGGINLARTWRVQVAGETRWQAGIEPLWVNNQVKLVKDLHCFRADLGYNLLDESVSFNLMFNW